MKTLEVTRQDCEHLLGQFLDESHYDTLIEEDCDVYLRDPLSPVENGEHNVILMFRKGWFSREQQSGAYDGLMLAAKPSQNRGLAAGPKGIKLQGRDWATPEQLNILDYLSKLGDTATFTTEDVERIRAVSKTKKDTRGMVWLADEKARLNFDFDRWLNSRLHDSMVDGVPGSAIRADAQYVRDNLISDTTYANPVDSGIAGWFDRYPRIPYGRATAYTAQNFERFQLSWPFMERLSNGFRDLLPQRWRYQMDCADRLDPSFRIPNTPFTTITVNKNFRTAAHRDAGDLAKGFSNLTVVARDNDYSGAYLVLPEVRTAVNIRPGDLLLVANHDFIHGNTPIVAKAGAELERISLVCYFREAMLELGSRTYEDMRYDYIEHRRKDPNHPLAREGWNGVSANCFDGDEFREFAERTGRLEVWEQYHAKTESSLESLFG